MRCGSPIHAVAWHDGECSYVALSAYGSLSVHLTYWPRLSSNGPDHPRNSVNPEEALSLELYLISSPSHHTASPGQSQPEPWLEEAREELTGTKTAGTTTAIAAKTRAEGDRTQCRRHHRLLVESETLSLWRVASCLIGLSALPTQVPI